MYLNSKDLSNLWHISQRRIIKLAKEGRIPGAKRFGRNWMIPDNACKPVDGRTRLSKQNKVVYDDFRYPCFAFVDTTNINPKLSDDELIIKKSQEQIYTCDFLGASKTLAGLRQDTSNLYCYVYSLYESCMIDIVTANTKNFVKNYQELHFKLSALQNPRKEFQFLIHEIDAALGNDHYFAKEFVLNKDYDFHQCFLSHLTVLNAVSLFNQGENTNISAIKAIQLACRFLEESNNVTDLQATYLYLANTLYVLNEYDEMRYYYKKVFDIAYQYDSIYDICTQYHYLKEVFDSILSDYPTEFRNKIKKYSKSMHACFNKISEDLSLNSIYRLLPSNYYPLIFYAAQGYVNKEIAHILNLSEATVNKRFAKIYDLSNVKSKNELIDLYRRTLDLTAIKKIEK